MGTYSQVLFHIVFSTRLRVPALVKEQRPRLFEYIWGIIKNRRGHLYRINGVEDHLHALTSIPPSMALADFVRDVKWISSRWIKNERVFPDFDAWQVGYAAFTHSVREKDVLIEYIKRQEEHHRTVLFLDELERLLRDAHIEFDESQLSSSPTPQGRPRE